jgi:alpha-N-arabinofuranosidase
MALNLGTRGVDAAVALLEYCNFPGGTKFSDLRRSHGVADPHDLRLWCLGNEMDGPWQVGQKTAEEYGRLAAETGKALRLLDPKIELVACGSSFAAMPTFPDWEATVLDLAWDQVDYLSLHSYYDNRSGDRDDFLASSAGMDAFIEAVMATCDHVKARKRSSKTIMLSFDEWNVWFRKPADERHVEPWRVAPPLLEEVYTLEDALAVGCLLASLLRHADRVKIACLAQLVNVLAPIMTRTGGPAWRQTIFWPFLHASRYARGESLSLLVDCPRYESARFGEVPWLEAAASLDEEQGKMAIFAVNRSSTEIIELEARLGGLAGWRAVERLELSGPDPLATNSEHEPGAVAPRNLAIEGLLDGEKLRAVLPPLSWTVLRLEGPRL